MIKVTELAFTGYPVTDIPRARGFYEGLLGLKPATVWEHQGKAWIEYEIGPSTLAINNGAGDQWKPSSDGPAAALEVEDFDAAVSALRTAGVPFVLEPTDSGACHIAVVLDPDRNSIAIHKRK